MLNQINAPITKLFAEIQNAVADNAACETPEQERAFMVAGGKERIYLNQLASTLTGNLINRLSDNVVEEEIITVYPEEMKGENAPTQSLNHSLFMVASYSVLMSGYTSKDIIKTALENWISEDNVITEQTLDLDKVASDIIIQFILDGILNPEKDTGQMSTGERFKAYPVTELVQELRINTMVKLWNNAAPKMKPMLHKLTWLQNGTCELKNFSFKEKVTQAFVDSFNQMGHTGYTVNPAIRAQIKRNLIKGKYPSDQVQSMQELLKLELNTVYYFPFTPDYRGRAYARGGLTTFQGVKDLRAVFDFAEQTKVDEYGLFLHIANACGFDKASITDRLQWVKDNHISLMTIPRDNLYAERARLAYIEYKTTGLSNIVCRIDGTCSGIQITSGIYLDKATGAAVNVGASSPDDEPSDIYGLVADVAIKLCKKANEKELLVKYHRDITKKVIMILSYGAGEQTRVKTVQDFLSDHGERPSYGANIQKVIMQAIELDFPAVTRLNTHLQIILADANPSKLVYSLSDIIVQIKPTNTEHLNLYGSSYTGKLVGKRMADPEALARGLAPNLVHSLDSELLRKAALKINSDVSCIHDDIGVQSGDVRKALQAVRTAYVEVIQAEPLKKIYGALDIMDEYEPDNNGLDLNDVLESAYLFS